MTMNDDVPMTVVTATCHTVGCGNADIPLAIVTPDPPGLIVCGPCGNPIEDVTQRERNGDDMTHDHPEHAAERPADEAAPVPEDGPDESVEETTVTPPTEVTPDTEPAPSDDDDEGADDAAH